jgi:hypothetical protein
VYGGGVSARALYSDDERAEIHARRPVILNGIEEFVRRGDLTDRTVFLHLPAITPTRRRDEAEFWDSFHTDYPRILGGVLDAVVGGLRVLPSVVLADRPRMAGYAKWGEAVGRGLGWPSETFLATYTANRKEATLAVLENSAVGMALLNIDMKSQMWECSAAALLKILTRFVGKKVAASARWPKHASHFSNELRRVAPLLGLHGRSVHRNLGHTDDFRHRERVCALRRLPLSTKPSQSESPLVRRRAPFGPQFPDPAGCAAAVRFGRATARRGLVGEGMTG